MCQLHQLRGFFGSGGEYGTPDAVCECVGDNNDHTFNLPMEIPDLMVTDTFNPTITCDTDGNVTVGGQVEIGNVVAEVVRPRMSR